MLGKDALPREIRFLRFFNESISAWISVPLLLTLDEYPNREHFYHPALTIGVVVYLQKRVHRLLLLV